MSRRGDKGQKRAICIFGTKYDVVRSFTTIHDSFLARARCEFDKLKEKRWVGHLAASLGTNLRDYER